MERGGGLVFQRADPALVEEATRLAEGFAARLAALWPDLASPEARGRYTAAACRSLQGKYSVFDRAMVASATRARAAGTEALLNRWLIAHLLAGFDLKASPLRIPDSVAPLYPADLRRILGDLTTREDAFYDLRLDAFLKEIGILTFRLIPVGCWYVEPWAGISRSLPLRRPTRQLVRSLRVLVRAGVRPYLLAHLHEAHARERQPEIWRPAHLRQADLVALNDRLKGILNFSWLMDPQLDVISPRVAWCSRWMIEGGASRFFFAADRRGEWGALDTSETRRRLFREGRYVPEAHVVIWPRRELLSWAQRVRAGVEPLYAGEPAVPLPAGPA